MSFLFLRDCLDMVSGQPMFFKAFGYVFASAFVSMDLCLLGIAIYAISHS